MEQVQIKFANLHKIITRNYLPLSHYNRAASCNHGGKSSFSVQLLSLETVPAAWDDLLISDFFLSFLTLILKHLQKTVTPTASTSTFALPSVNTHLRSFCSSAQKTLLLATSG